MTPIVLYYSPYPNLYIYCADKYTPVYTLIGHVLNVKLVRGGLGMGGCTIKGLNNQDAK